MTMRRESDKEQIERIARMELQLEMQSKDIMTIQALLDCGSKSVEEIKRNIIIIEENNQKYQPVMDDLDALTKAGKVAKWFMAGILGILGLTVTIITIWDYIVKK